MDELGYDQKSKSSIERLVLFLMSWYLFGMISGTVALGMSSAYIVFFAAIIVIVWAVYLGKVKDYHFRAHFDAIAMLVAVLVHMIRLPNSDSSWTTYLIFVVILGMFGIPSVVRLSYISTTIMLINYLMQADFFRSGYGTATLLQVFVLSLTGYIGTYVVHYIVRKQLEAQEVLLENLDELSEIQKSKDDFLVNVSHELRTPVNVISGMTELLKDEEGLSDEAREKLNNIIIASRNLNSSISDILDFTELQSGNISIQETSYSVISVVDDVVKLSAERFREKKLTFIVNVDPDIPTKLVGDPGKIERVIMNILGNAIKFTNDGCVSLDVSTRKTKYGVNLNIAIIDTGKGMKREAIEKIFTSFNQVDTRRNRSEGGIGLGMAICKELVDKMGGNIMVESAVGKGTKVWFSVPQKIDDEAVLVYIRNVKNKRIAFCADLDSLGSMQVRDAYQNNINRMLTSLKLDFRYFRNVAELKRGITRIDFTHILITDTEYEKDRAFFDNLVKRGNNRITILMDAMYEGIIADKGYSYLYRPLHTVKIAEMINEEDSGIMSNKHRNAFIAPDANVLVVDDNRMNIAVVKGLLSKYKINVTGALSGYEALDKLSNNTGYDLIFMDHMMPEMDGVETFKAIRSKPGIYYREVPIIVLTANVVAGTREFFLEQGFTDYVPKPVDPSLLDAVLRKNIVKSKQLPADKAYVSHSEHFDHIEEKKTAVEEKAVEAEDKAAAVEEKAVVADDDPLAFLNEDEAYKYCGNKDGLVEMMKINYEDAPENIKKLQAAYDKEDWKNYTIYIHGLKSAMRTIGVAKLTEMAAKLEAAGKADNGEYIKDNHQAAMVEYRNILEKMAATKLFDVQETGEDIFDGNSDNAGGSDAPEQNEPEVNEQELEQISAAEFDEFCVRFEDQAFAMDGEKMSEMLGELSGKALGEVCFDKEFTRLKHKIEMGDYLSAYDMLQELKR